MSVTTTRSSIRTPNCPGRYTPGSTVTTLPLASTESERCDSRGASWISSPTPCPSPWPKCSAWPAVADHLARRSVGLAAARRRPARPPAPPAAPRARGRTPPGSASSSSPVASGAGAVRAVAVQLGAPVDHHQLVGSDLDVARLGVRQRAVRTGGDDRVKGGPLGPEVAHRPLQGGGDAHLGAPHQPPLHDLAQRGVRELGRLGDPPDLLGVLDRAQRLDEVAPGDQLDSVAQLLAQPAVRAHGQVGVLEGQARRAGRAAGRGWCPAAPARRCGQRPGRPGRPTARRSGSR